MTGGVNIHEDNNFDMRLESAVMDFKDSVMTSDKPVLLKIDGGEVAAQSVGFFAKGPSRVLRGRRPFGAIR